jgi:hypothetical protein
MLLAASLADRSLQGEARDTAMFAIVFAAMAIVVVVSWVPGLRKGFGQIGKDSQPARARLPTAFSVDRPSISRQWKVAVGATALELIFWFAMINTGGLFREPDLTASILSLIPLVTALISCAALLLLGPIRDEGKLPRRVGAWLPLSWVFVAAGLGIFVVPAIALREIEGVVRFERYVGEVSPLFLLIPAGAAVFKLRRAGGNRSK